MDFLGDMVLIGLRDYEDAKGDVILKYNDDESRSLKSYGELPDSIKLNEGIIDVEDEEDKDNDIGFDFNVDEI